MEFKTALFSRSCSQNHQKTRTRNTFRVEGYHVSNIICVHDKFLLMCVLFLLLIKISPHLCPKELSVWLGQTFVPNVCFSSQAVVSNVVFQTQQGSFLLQQSQSGINAHRYLHRWCHRAHYMMVISLLLTGISCFDVFVFESVERNTMHYYKLDQRLTSLFVTPLTALHSVICVIPCTSFGS